VLKLAVTALRPHVAPAIPFNEPNDVADFHVPMPSLRCLTVKLRGRREAPDKRRGRTLSSGARGAQPPAVHGPLQRLLEVGNPTVTCPPEPAGENSHSSLRARAPLVHPRPSCPHCYGECGSCLRPRSSIPQGDMDLTRFCGHFMFTKEGDQDGEVTAQIHAGVSTPDGGTAPGRTHLR
jgi:hypothetical protein